VTNTTHDQTSAMDKLSSYDIWFQEFKKKCSCERQNTAFYVCMS
jgi:hypothetical protein